MHSSCYMLRSAHKAGSELQGPPLLLLEHKIAYSRTACLHPCFTTSASTAPTESPPTPALCRACSNPEAACWDTHRSLRGPSGSCRDTFARSCSSVACTACQRCCKAWHSSCATNSASWSACLAHLHRALPHNVLPCRQNACAGRAQQHEGQHSTAKTMHRARRHPCS